MSLLDLLDQKYIGPTLIRIYDGIVDPDQLVEKPNKWYFRSVNDLIKLQKKYNDHDDNILEVAFKEPYDDNVKITDEEYEILYYIPTTDKFIIGFSRSNVDNINEDDNSDNDSYDEDDNSDNNNYDEENNCIKLSEYKVFRGFVNIHDWFISSYNLQYNYEDIIKIGSWNETKSALDILDTKIDHDSIPIYHGILDNDKKIILNEWIFLSANEIKSHEYDYQYIFIDIAIHNEKPVKISFIPKTSNFFFRTFDDFVNDPLLFPIFEPLDDEDNLKKPKDYDEYKFGLQYDYDDLIYCITDDWIAND
jgi:hypothetical protein